MRRTSSRKAQVRALGMVLGCLVVVAYASVIASNGVGIVHGGLPLSHLLALPFHLAEPIWLDLLLAVGVLILFAWISRVLLTVQHSRTPVAPSDAGVTLLSGAIAGKASPHDMAADSRLPSSGITQGPLVETPDSSPRVFISHSSGDDTFGKWLTEQLLVAGLDVWYDKLGGPTESGDWKGGIAPSSYWQDEIVRELTGRKVFIIILTPRAMQSRWVQEEIRLAWSDKNSSDPTRGKVVVPILREKCSVNPLVAQVQSVNFVQGVDEASALNKILFAVRNDKTIPAPPVQVGPPFDLAVLPPLERFVGREAIIEEVMARLVGGRSAHSSHVASIAAANGIGGIGKTALATEVVRRLMALHAFPDGIAVYLAKQRTNPVAMLKGILSRFTNGRTEPDADTLTALNDQAQQILSGKHALVVLDNVEQNWPVEQVIAPVRLAGLSFLVTSRAELSVLPQAARIELNLLTLEEALDVFVEYFGGAARPDLPADDITAITSIVKALGYHTLAMKLAAANAHILHRDLGKFASELESSPSKALLLEDGNEAVRFVFDSSVESLSRNAVDFLAVMTAFATSDFGRDAAFAVGGSVIGEGENVERSLKELVVLRLVETALNVTMPVGSDRERLRLHPLVQTFARQLFGELSAYQRDGAYRIMAEWYAGYAAQAPELSLAVDEDNLSGAVAWAETAKDNELVFRLRRRQVAFVTRLGQDLQRRGKLIEAEERFKSILPIAQGLSDQKRQGHALTALGEIAFQNGRLHEAERYFRQSLEIGRQRQDWRDEGKVLSYLGHIAQRRGDLAEAERLYQRALAINRDTHELPDEVVALSSLGQVAQQRGDLAAAERFYQHALVLNREVRDPRGECVVLSNLGRIAQDRGQLVEAVRYYQQALLISRRLYDRHGEGEILASLGQVAQRRGQYEEAETYYQQALLIDREERDRRGEGIALSNLGQLAQARGQLEQAEGYYQQALHIDHEVQDRQGEGVDLSSLGQVALARGQFDVAASYYQQALVIAREVQDRQGEGVVLNSLGQIGMARGQLDAAADYFQQSLAIRREVQDRRGEGADLAQLGQLAEERQRWDEAESYYRQGLALMRAVQDAPNEASIALFLGEFLIERRGNRTEGCPLVLRAVAIRQEQGLPGVDAAIATAKRLGCIADKDDAG